MTLTRGDGGVPALHGRQRQGRAGARGAAGDLPPPRPETGRTPHLQAGAHARRPPRARSDPPDSARTTAFCAAPSRCAGTGSCSPMRSAATWPDGGIEDRHLTATVNLERDPDDDLDHAIDDNERGLKD